MRRLPLLLLLAACAAPDPAAGGRRATEPPPPGVVQLALLPGSVVRLEPVTASPAPPADPVFIDALWREAMRQSVRLDVAAGIEDTASPFSIAVHIDSEAGRASSTLRREGKSPVPLASAAGELPLVLDPLAIATRQALGEHIAQPAASCVAIYSGNTECVQLTERAAAQAQNGERRRALALLRKARPRDPGCTVTLEALAKNLLAVGTAGGDRRSIEEASRTAVEALQLSDRSSPTTEHKLAHTALVARGVGTPSPGLDRGLLELGDVALRERPFDPHVQYTRAIALNFLGDYAEATPMLRHLAVRWPSSAEVAYHLCFAELAVGDPQAALAAIRRASPRLPRHSIVVPMSLALYHCDRQDELKRYLADLARDPVYRKSAGLHELRRMQAAQSLLTDDRDAAVRFMLEDLEWLRQRPSRLESYALDVAETGEVMVRIGQYRDLEMPLEAFEQLGDLPPTFAQVMVFLGGLIQVAAQDSRAEAAEAHLSKGGQAVWASLVKAAAHRRRGELMDELKERVFEYQSTESALVRADLARALYEARDVKNAAEVLDELRTRLLGFHLRNPRDHPLMGPENALAFLATEELTKRLPK